MRSAGATRRDAGARASATPDTPAPEVQLLSNGRYHVMVTNAGGGYSRWKDLAVTRWREDATRDHWGSFCYLRDADERQRSGRPRSSRRCSAAEAYEAIFSEAAPSSAAATRASTRTPRSSSRPRTTSSCAACASPTAAACAARIEVTSYAEVVLAPADRRRAASGVQQPVRADRDRCSDPQAILCTRRPRSPEDADAVDVPPAGGARRRSGAGCRTRPTARASSAAATALARAAGAARRRGRCRTRAGSVLDPIVAIRCVITLEPDQTASSTWSPASPTTATPASRWSRSTRTAASPIACSSWPGRTARWCCASSTRARPMRSCTRASPSSVIYAQPTLRAEPRVLLRNRRGQSGLWGYAISGDLPIVLLQIGERGQHRAGAPAGAGARLLAPQGPGGRPGDLERGARRLPAAAAGPDHGPDRRRRSKRT